MSSVKISQLTLISQLNANTSNTLFVAVDVPSGVTGKFTGKTLAQGLYSNEVLNVGKGFAYTANVYSTNQTAITIDVANTSLTKANTTAGLVVTLSNLLAGKETVLWIVNAAGTSQIFTHGLSALNSTTNSTTYNVSGTSSILVRYMCIGNTLANTFVAITHA